MAYRSEVALYIEDENRSETLGVAGLINRISHSESAPSNISDAAQIVIRHSEIALSADSGSVSHIRFHHDWITWDSGCRELWDILRGVGAALGMEGGLIRLGSDPGDISESSIGHDNRLSYEYRIRQPWKSDKITIAMRNGMPFVLSAPDGIEVVMIDGDIQASYKSVRERLPLDLDLMLMNPRKIDGINLVDMTMQESMRLNHACGISMDGGRLARLIGSGIQARLDIALLSCLTTMSSTRDKAWMQDIGIEFIAELISLGLNKRIVRTFAIDDPKTAVSGSASKSVLNLIEEKKLSSASPGKKIRNMPAA